MSEPVAVFFVDLNLRVDEWQSATTWEELQSGSREAVVEGAPVVVTDDDDAFEATVTDVTPVGPRFAVHWEHRVSVPGRAQPASLG